MTTPRPTHADYLNGRATFAEYYGSIAREAGISYANSPLLPKIRAALANGDVHLNSITLATWDLHALRARPAVLRVLRSRGEGYSLAVGVCIQKQAARDAATEETEHALSHP